ncbi:hypothetical protein BPAE_0275g00110 [Botrytis paeoniae]|uniref:Ketoreductase (KR) domain-containing protein n=1 Tax=Botrytis paeoniae TaxID=278948 RepID=A0A4Z1FAZ5_9HELO|nr:hypothetical protein BPAE_0275g00110 [Botrytis paeoniae]
MTFPYKHVLLIGATSGIGLAMAERLVQKCKVTVVGRRKDRLDEFVAKHGDKAKSIAFDIGDTEKASQFAADVIESSPDIDCVFLNAGYQRKHDFSKPESVDIKGFNYEMHRRSRRPASSSSLPRHNFYVTSNLGNEHQLTR